MKIIKIYALMLMLIMPFINKAQEDYTEREKQFALTELSKPESKWHNPSLYSVYENKVYEAIPIIENNFWNFDRGNKTLALKALHRLNSANTSEFAYRLLDTLNAYPTHLQWKTSISKVEITEILCEMGDFSTVEYAFDILEQDRKRVLGYTPYIFFMIIKYYPPYEERARSELEYNVLNKTDVGLLSSLRYLEEVYGAEMIPFLIKVFKESPESATRMIILNKYFKKYHNEIDLQGLLREQLYADTTNSVRLRIAKVLLFGVGGTRNYNFVKNYIPNENDLTIKTLLEYKIESYHPDPFDSTTTTETMLDTLTSYTDQSYNYNWLNNEAYKDELFNKIVVAKNYLLLNDSLSCRTQIKLFQNSVEQVYQDSASSHPKYISDAGYKFMYYQAEYILERLPDTDPLPVELTMFVGDVVDTTVVLHWQTATEINNYGFSVEQNSILFPDWREIGFVEGHGNSYSPKKYTFVDTLSSIDTVADTSTQLSYRLKQIDTNGGYKYSKIITVIIEY